MINEHDRRILEALEQEMCREDADFAGRLGNGSPDSRWRAAGRRAVAWPILVLVAALAMTSFVLNLSAFGLLFLGWALGGGVYRLACRANRRSPEDVTGPESRWPY